MGFVVDYTPIASVLDLARQGGVGKGRWRQWEAENKQYETAARVKALLQRGDIGAAQVALAGGRLSETERHNLEVELAGKATREATENQRQFGRGVATEKLAQGERGLDLRERGVGVQEQNLSRLTAKDLADQTMQEQALALRQRGIEVSEGELALAKQKAADFLNTSAGKVLMRRAELLQREQLALARERAGIDKTLATGIVLDQAAARRLRDQQVEYEDRERANRAEQTDVFGQIHQGAFPQPAAQPSAQAAPPPPRAPQPAQADTAPNGLPYAAAGSRLPNGLQAATALHVQIVASRISANWREADPRQVEQALNEMGLSALYEPR